MSSSTPTPKQATVRAAVDDRVLILEVRDDGIGGSDHEGHDLTGIADRLDALGGRLVTQTPVRDGTALVARSRCRLAERARTTLVSPRRCGAGRSQAGGRAAGVSP